MQFGLIGEKLGHSFSKSIHEQLGQYSYELKELSRAELGNFMCEKAFCGVNVTIPYKQEVMRYLDEIDPVAAKIGAVNTVVNRGGVLKGYNTDFAGLKALVERSGAQLQGRKVLICGSGGTSLTALYAARALGAASVYRLSRSAAHGCISYESAYAEHTDAAVIINTTPVGMYPQTGGSAIDLERFEHLEAVFDVVYNPLRTDLVLAAKQRGLIAQGGLYMLVAQAVYASAYFLDTKCSEERLESVYRSILSARENIVLSGMPGSGKSTVGKLLATELQRPFADTDALVESAAGMPISEIFRQRGEAHFRRLESEAIARLSAQAGGKVIALGGGAVLNPDNVRLLRHNGKIYFLNRSIEDIVPTADRPLALDRQALQQRFEERFDIYCSTADRVIAVSGDAASVVATIGKDYGFES